MRYQNHKNVLFNVRSMCSHSTQFVRDNNRRVKLLQTHTAKHNNGLLFGSTNNEKIQLKYRTNFMTSLKNAFEITKLCWKHDPNFNIKSFEKGSKQV